MINLALADTTLATGPNNVEYSAASDGLNAPFFRTFATTSSTSFPICARLARWDTATRFQSPPPARCPRHEMPGRGSTPLRRAPMMAFPSRTTPSMAHRHGHQLRSPLPLSQKINLSTSLAGQAVGVKEFDHGIWLVSFMEYDLG